MYVTYFCTARFMSRVPIILNSYFNEIMQVQAQHIIVQSEQMTVFCITHIDHGARGTRMAGSHTRMTLHATRTWPRP